MRTKTNKSKGRMIEIDEPWFCECGSAHEIGGYAAAHWRESLRHTCDNCGRVHTLQMGYLKLVKGPTKK